MLIHIEQLIVIQNCFVFYTLIKSVVMSSAGSGRGSSSASNDSSSALANHCEGCSKRVREQPQVQQQEQIQIEDAGKIDFFFYVGLRNY